MVTITAAAAAVTTTTRESGSLAGEDRPGAGRNLLGRRCVASIGSISSSPMCSQVLRIAVLSFDLIGKLRHLD
jgi:hypothetical protein